MVRFGFLVNWVGFGWKSVGFVRIWIFGKFGRIWLDLVGLVGLLVWSDSVGFGGNLSDLIRFGRIWSDLVRFGQIWSDLVRFDRIWFDLVRVAFGRGPILGLFHNGHRIFHNKQFLLKVTKARR